MDLAGQGASGQSRPGRSNLDDGGYILAVLLIGMAIAAVWMSAAIPAWRQQTTRQRELELIFRGEQYARSVALYYVKNCTLPTNVDDLVARKFLRKKWNDPITNDDFIIIPGNPQGGGGVPVQGGTPGRAGTPGAAGQPGRAGAPVSIGGGAPVSIGGGPTGGAQAPRPGTIGGSPTGGVPGTGGQTTAGSGIAGVMSKSTAASIIVYNGQQTYQGWQFLYQTQLQKMGQQPQCNGNQPGAPGAAGRGNQPGQQGRGDGRGGPTGPAIGGGPGRPGGPGRGGPGGDGRGPVTATPGVGRGRGGD